MMDVFEGRDIRAAAVFGTYLSTCLGLTVLICSNLHWAYGIRTNLKPKKHDRAPPPFQKSLLKAYVLLAGVCLALTWYYMISFFALSYNVWALHHAASTFNLQTAAAWLKDVQLFRDAWEVALETPGRLVWSQPIFFITALWSIFVCREARERAIPYAWAYMLLGQIVAISFAQSLFFLAVVIYPSNRLRPQSLHDPISRIVTAVIYTIVVILTVVPVSLIPTSTNTSRFLTILLLPHIALMLPPLLSVTAVGGESEDKRIPGLTRIAYIVLFAAGVALEWRVLISALADGSPDRHIHRHSELHPVTFSGTTAVAGGPRGLQSLATSFYSHPAVSSVGFDVILSTASSIVWYIWTSTVQI